MSTKNQISVQIPAAVLAEATENYNPLKPCLRLICKPWRRANKNQFSKWATKR